MQSESSENNDRKQERRQKIIKHKKKNTAFYDEDIESYNKLKKEFKKTKKVSKTKNGKIGINTIIIRYEIFGRIKYW